jgi:hypothetical protein
MNAPQRRITGRMVIFTLSYFALPLVGSAQSTGPAATTPGITIRSTTAQSATSPTAAAPKAHAPMSAEQEAIWNSPNMLRARAWLQEYCETSKKVTPEEAQQYTDELEHMSPVQMKLWLLKFDEEEDQKKQQRAFYQQAQTVMLKQAKAADLATQKSDSEIESEETAAASEEQGQVNEQEANEQQNQDVKQAGPYTPYGQGYYPGAGGGIHYHFHLYPY